MFRGGGLCLAGPGDTNINKVSPRIRALQDRLMDSLPSDGAWECLSPAQREAIIALHRSRLASTDDSSEHGEHGHHGGAGGRPSALKKQTRTQGLPRFGRSRSYDDRLESETDDSGVRGVNGTNSSGAASHEDDSSDQGVKRGGGGGVGGGRFAKAASADRATKRDVKNEMHELNNMKNIRKTEVVTNGFGNVNKIISKQMNKCGAVPNGTSNITLDCRNVQGEKRRRSRIDVDGVFRDCSLERNLEAMRESNTSSSKRTSAGSDSQQNRVGISRRNILADNYVSENKLHSLKEVKETVSSEEYDSGVNFKNDDSVDEYIRNRQKGGCDLNHHDFESDRTPRSDSTSPTLPVKRERSNDKRPKGDDLTTRKPSSEKDPFGGWDHAGEKMEKTRSREREGRSVMSHSLDKHYQERAKAKSGGEPLKSNLKVGYGAKLNSTFDYRTNLNQDQMNKYSSNWNNMILSCDVPIKPSQTPSNGRESRFTKNASAGAMTRSTGNLANKSAMAAQKKGDPANWGMSDPRRTPNASQDRSAGKKYVRSKSLDRKYLDEDTSDEDSDFETRRRTERTRRYNRSGQEWEVGGGRLRPDDKIRFRSREMLDYKYNYNNQNIKPKAKSAWDLSGQSKRAEDDFDEFEDVGFRTRSDFRNRWQSEDSDVTRRKKVSDSSGEFNRMQWNRRSCDFELDYPSEERERKLSEKSVEFDRKRWYRRSCDIDQDFEYHNRQRREVEFDVDWGRRALEQYDDFEPEPVVSPKSNKKNRIRIAEQQQQLMQAHDVERMSKVRYGDPLITDMRRMEDENCRKMRMEDDNCRKMRMENENGRQTRMDDFGERRMRLDDIPPGGRVPQQQQRLDDDAGRRTRLEEHYRSKTSMGHHGREKRERSKTPHLLRGKLRLLKSILSF